MKKNLLNHGRILGLVTVIAFAAVSCEDTFVRDEFQDSVQPKTVSFNATPSDYCGEPMVSTLFAGQHIDAGTVTVGNDNDFVYVTYETTGGWELKDVHLFVGNMAYLPTNKAGNPMIGQFPVNLSFNPYETSYTATYSIAELSECFIIAAHAVVVKTVDGEIVENETAWGYGELISQKGSWATYMSYCIQECNDDEEEEEILPGDFRTQTQGGWGAGAQGNNPGAYRDANFDAAFPNGLVVGGLYTLTLTSSEAAQMFLPQGGTANALDGNYIDPFSSSAGVFGGQVVALTLSVGFDLYDPDFGASSVNLKDLVFVNGVFQGKTVEYVLAEANRVLGGGLVGNYSISHLNSAVASVNENFVDGEIVGTVLSIN